jgi:hypothetical protein
MPKKLRATSSTDRHAERFAQLRQQLQVLGYFCKGTVLERRMKCGQPNCVCHQDPSKRHGPYWEWTYKVHSKTVNVKLSSEAGPLYKAASKQYRTLKTLLNQLERISRATLAARAKQAKTRKTP